MKTPPIICLLLSSALFILPSCQKAGKDKQSATTNNTTWQLPDTPKEAHVKTSQNLNFPADQVWKLIAGFNTLSDYNASIVDSKLLQGGAVRHVTLSDEAGGGVVVERLVYFNDETKTFSYKIIDLIDCDLALRNYQARVHLTSTGPNTCLLEWESSFDVEGATVEDTKQLTRDIYQGCYDGINKVLGKQ
jgi:hypothetical protein